MPSPLSFELTDLATARARAGVRLVILEGEISAWSEAAKLVFVAKGIPTSWVFFVPRDEEMLRWTGTHNAPVAFFDDELPRSHWSEILVRAERWGGPPLLSPEPERRAQQIGLVHELVGEEGLAWSLRALAIGASLATDGARSFSAPVGRYLARKYGVPAHRLPAVRETILEQLRRWERRLATGARSADDLDAVDIYLAATTLVVAPPRHPLWQGAALPAREGTPVVREMERARAFLSAELGPHLPLSLLEHRDRVLERILIDPSKMKSVR